VTVDRDGFGSLLTYLPMYSQLSCVLMADSEDFVDVWPGGQIRMDGPADVIG